TFTAKVYNSPDYVPTINPDPAEPNTSNDLDEIGRASCRERAEMSVEVAGPAAGDEGEDLTYSLVVTNNGPETSLRFVASPWKLGSGWGAVSVSVGGTDCGYPGIPYLCHVFARGGRHRMSLRVWSSDVCSAALTFTAKVYNSPDYVPTINPDPADPNTSNDLD